MSFTMLLASLSLASALHYDEYVARTAYKDHGGVEIDTDDTAPTGFSVANCENRCDEDASCSCVSFRPSDGKCWKRAACDPSQFGTDQDYTTYVKASPAPPPPGPPGPLGAWQSQPWRNCYEGHGADEIDSQALEGVTDVDECKEKCNELLACTAITVGNDGTCFRRANIDIASCDSSSDFYTTWMRFPAPTPAPPGVWYEGIDSIYVINPGDEFDFWRFYQTKRFAQFSDKHHAVLLTSGDHSDAEIGVGYYTSILGVGRTQNDVKVKSFYALNEDDGHSTNNFWRSVEGVTVSNSITYSVSQASGVRRATFHGDVHLSEQHGYSSGGYMSNVDVSGYVDPGTQQQYFFRNSKLNSIGKPQYNLVFVGSEGGWDEAPKVANIPATPRIAEKPFLMEQGGKWSIVVPDDTSDSVGVNDVYSNVRDIIAMDDVFVAREGDTAETIIAGIVGKRALLFTPGVYGLEKAITISDEEFVVLGIGLPLLVPYQGNAAIVVESEHVRVAGLLLEAGTPNSDTKTDPLLLWTGDFGVLSDIFTRTGAFSYQRDFHESCLVTRADVHVQLDGSDMIVDNTWFWHADHDDCNTKSDQCYDEHGLVVNGDRVTIYGLFVEHQFKDLTQWNGEDGRVFFYQSELPYDDGDFGKSGYTGYSVSLNVQKHTAVGLGVYVVFDRLWGVTAYRGPRGVDFRNRVICGFGNGHLNQFNHFGCYSDGDDQCYNGYEQCGSNVCWLSGDASETLAVV